MPPFFFFYIERERERILRLQPTNQVVTLVSVPLFGAQLLSRVSGAGQTDKTVKLLLLSREIVTAQQSQRDRDSRAIVVLTLPL